MNKIVSGFKLLGLIVILFVSINSKAQCNPSFTYSQGANGVVNFTSTSTLANSLTAQYYWFFNNPPFTYSATGLAGTTLSLTYTNNGVYTVTLTVVQPTACNSSTQVTFTVTSNCILNASANFTQGANGFVNFNNASTGTVSGTTYTWNFGDGSALSNSVSPPHTYTSNGIYTVTLFANNNSVPTCTSLNTFTVNVNSICNFTAGINAIPLANGNFSFSATTNASSLTTNTYTWNFSTPSPSTNVASAVVNYTANGIYTINLAVTNSAQGCTATATQTIFVNNVVTCNVTASFTAVQGMNGSYYFPNISTGTVAGTSYLWNFGDGSATSNLNSPSHTYSLNGSYTVSLTANNNFTPACVNTKTLVIVVNSNCNLNANFVYTLGVNGLATFSNTSTLPNPTVAVKHSWSFGAYGTSTVTNPSITYTSNGIYSVILYDTIVSLSCSSSITKTLNITNVGFCGLNALFTHTLGSGGFTNFTNHSTGTLSSTTYTWNFGDGFISTALNPTHTYINAGTHYVSLIAVNSATCMDTTYFALNVTGVTCNANSSFSLSPTSTPQYWNAIPSYPWNVANAVWSWGDNSSTNALYPSHQYAASGNYNICLTVTASCGGTSSTCATYSVYKSAGGIININVIKPAGVVEITGLNDIGAFNNESYNVYPNPNNGLFVVKFNAGQNFNSICVRNIVGEIVYLQSNLNISEGEEKQLDLSDRPTGIYFVELRGSTKMFTKKIIISK